LIFCIGDEYLLLELDALGTTVFANVALKTNRHVFFENAIIADAWKIFGIPARLDIIKNMVVTAAAFMVFMILKAAGSTAFPASEKFSRDPATGPGAAGVPHRLLHHNGIWCCRQKRG
jgi:hypothetical protein